MGGWTFDVAPGAGDASIDAASAGRTDREGRRRTPRAAEARHTRPGDHARPRADRPVRGVAVAGRHVRVGDRAEARRAGMVRRDGGVRGAELRLHVAADRPVPRVEPLLRDRHGAGRRERGQQGGARREPDGRRDAVPAPRRRGDGPRAHRHRDGGCVADQRRDAVRAAGSRGARDRRRGRRRPGPRARRVARCGRLRPPGRGRGGRCFCSTGRSGSSRTRSSASTTSCCVVVRR